MDWNRNKLMLKATIYFTQLLVLLFIQISSAIAFDYKPAVEQITPYIMREQADVKQQHIKVEQSIPINFYSFTEGMVKHGDDLYLSSGLYGMSKVIDYSLSQNKVIKEVNLPANYFAEGLTFFNNKLYLLTYKSNRVFIYDKHLNYLSSFSIPSQGWGLTHDTHDLIISNGSGALMFIDPNTHQLTHFLTVSLNINQTLINLNELEYVNGTIYANIWPSGIIVKINALNGQLQGWFDISSLWQQQSGQSYSCVPNGIAYDKQHQDLILGGKCWHRLFIVKEIS